MDKNEALRLALKALEDIGDEWGFTSQRTVPKRKEAITAIKEALAQPEQKPVAVYRSGQAKGEVYHVQFFKEMAADEVLLYAVPVQCTWIGLTEDEVFEISNKMPYADRFDFAEAIEAKLKEWNNG
jgi:hypothetical protein